MSRSGHLHALKEAPSFTLFLTQLAIQTQVNISLLELDGTILFEAYGLESGSFCDCSDTSYQVSILQLIKSHKPGEPCITTCGCKKPLLLLPISAKDAMGGVLAVCPFKENQQQLLIGTSGIISNYLSLARNAVHKSKKAFDILDAHEELFGTTELLTNPEVFYNSILEILLSYIDMEAGILVPYTPDTSRWSEPVFKSKESIDQSWLAQMASWATNQHDSGRCPMIVSAENSADYPKFREMNASAFISSTIYHAEIVLGIIIFCSRSESNTSAFDDLALLESLKGMISLRLFNLHNQMFKERVLQDAFHSLKAPAHSITSLVDIISSEIDTVSQQHQEYLKLLKEEAKRLFRLTQKAPMLARLHNSAGVQDKISLKAVIVDVATTFKTIALTAKNVIIILKTPDENCDIMGNKDELQEVLENLLENSLGFTEKNKAIYINLEIKSSVYQVSIIDEGPGIPQNQREIIFDEFKSIPRAGNPESSGLGLAISRKIVEAHRGVLKYVEPPNNLGACFTFTLPKL